MVVIPKHCETRYRIRNIAKPTAISAQKDHQVDRTNLRQELKRSAISETTICNIMQAYNNANSQVFESLNASYTLQERQKSTSAGQ